MYIVTTTFTRPSTDVLFYMDAHPEIRNQFNSFVTAQTGKNLITMSATKDDLQQVVVAVYESEEALNQLLVEQEEAFPGLFNDRDKYCLDNNITVTREVEQL